MQRCSRCVLPQTYPGIILNDEQVCNFCLTHGEVPPLGEDKLRSVLDEYRGKNAAQYDCLVALSGGRDSSYTLYYAVRVLNLKVLAFTIDNGFMPDQTHENIRNAVSILSVDHVVEKHDLLEKNIRTVVSAWLHRPSPAMIPLLCVGCRLALYRGFLDVASRYQIPLMLTGLGEPETSFATKLFSSSANTTRRTMDLALGLGVEIMKNPQYLRKPTLPYSMFMEYLYAFSPVMQRRIYPELRNVRLFEYIGWDEQKIMSLIQTELKWRNYSYSRSAWRSDCKINLLRNHFYKVTLGFTKNEELVSNMIRLGEMSREDGLARVEHEGVISEEFLREFFQEIGIRYQEYEDGVARINKVTVGRAGI
jgi:hypothetical protein